MTEDTNEHLGSSVGSSDGFPVCGDFLMRENKVLQERLIEMQSNVDLLKTEVRSVLDQLDHLATVWGDEGVFRRCRERLRKVLD
ncbi:MAG: hypothetical protein ACK517_04590, partial [bacterium]